MTTLRTALSCDACGAPFPLEQLQGNDVVITGASGLKLRCRALAIPLNKQGPVEHVCLACVIAALKSGVARGDVIRVAGPYGSFLEDEKPTTSDGFTVGGSMIAL